MADLYFKKFEKIYYLTRVGNKEELKVLTDITTNVRLRKKILQNITAYEFYNQNDFMVIQICIGLSCSSTTDMTMSMTFH